MPGPSKENAGLFPALHQYLCERLVVFGLAPLSDSGTRCFCRKLWRRPMKSNPGFTALHQADR